MCGTWETGDYDYVPLGCLLRLENAMYATIRIPHDTNDSMLPIRRHVCV